jgi:3-hydroxyisobutyrate dehydrogenase-like beta-hydroxyacid dehydrogenase
MSEHFGLLAYIAEAAELQQQLGCSADEAFEIQRQLAAEREADREKAEQIVQAAAESNVIPFRRKH